MHHIAKGLLRIAIREEAPPAGKYVALSALYTQFPRTNLTLQLSKAVDM